MEVASFADEVVPSHQLKERSLAWASYAALLGPDSLHSRRLSHRPLSDPTNCCQQYRNTIPPVDRGGQAQHAAISAISGDGDEGELFMHLLQHSLQSRALRHLFFAERLAKKSTHLYNASTKLLTKGGGAIIGIVGAGTMGCGIAIAFLRSDYYESVILVDNHLSTLEKAKSFIASVLASDVKKNRMHPNTMECLSNHVFRTSTQLEELRHCDLVLEAVYENLALKQSIFHKLDHTVLNPKALFLSNTSSLDIDSIFANVTRTGYCAGMHFFSPAHVMKLVEIIQGSHSNFNTVHCIQTIANKVLQKLGVTVKNCEGFVGNRMLAPYSSESVLLLTDGNVTVQQVDHALKNYFGMAMGPFHLSDLAGNDIGYSIRKEKGLVKNDETEIANRREETMRYTELADDLVMKLGRVGMKVKKGWYDYDDKIGKGRTPIVSQEVTDFIALYNSTTNKDGRSDEDIVERVLFPLVNEGFQILHENIAKRPSDIDIIYVHGYGWPSWRGGPMFWADHYVGLPYLLHRLEMFQIQYPGSDYFIPSPLLKKCVSVQMGIQEYYESELSQKQKSDTSKL